MSRARSAFTLVELLVVIAIIGVLIALLLPAIQSAREAARRMQCANNLKQVGIALQMHHDAKKHLPAGWLAFDPATGQPDPEGEPGWGWAAMILPFMEEGNLAAQIDYRLPIADPKNKPARDKLVTIYRCPSDPGEDTFSLDKEDGSGPLFDLPKANYVGVFGNFDVEDPLPGLKPGEGNGVFYHNRKLQYREIRDGLSKTLVVGERYSRNGGSTWTGMISGAEEAAERTVGIADDMFNHLDGHVGDFGSEHAGACQFLFADGSVDTLVDTMDLAVFKALCTRAGGETSR